MRLVVSRSDLFGEIDIPASKSHTIRAVFIGSLADGSSELIKPLDALDTQAAVHCAQAFGATVKQGENWLVEGVGNHPKVPDDVLVIQLRGAAVYRQEVLVRFHTHIHVPMRAYDAGNAVLIVVGIAEVYGRGLVEPAAWDYDRRVPTRPLLSPSIVGVACATPLVDCIAHRQYLVLAIKSVQAITSIADYDDALVCVSKQIHRKEHVGELGRQVIYRLCLWMLQWNGSKAVGEYRSEQ